MASDLQTLTKELSAAVDAHSSASGAAKASQRKKILQLAKDIRYEVEEPMEHLDDHMAGGMEMAAIRVLMDWGAFEKIPPPGSPEATITYAQLAAELNADVSLVRRMVWMCVSRGVLRQVGEDRVAHTKLSPIFAEKESYAQWWKFTYDSRAFVSTQWPRMFAETGRKEPDETFYVRYATQRPIERAAPPRTFWDFLKDEDRLDEFMTAMKIINKYLPAVGMFPYKWIVENERLVPGDAALVVDVGGSHGEALQGMLEECPDLPAERLVLQDRPPVIEEANRLDSPALRGIKRMAHDFFTPQPVKGALVYFIKRCLHDWSDDDSRVILGHLRDAMAPQSRLLINESVMSNPPQARTCVADLGMLNLGGKERTEAHWRELLGSINLKIVKIWKTENPLGDVAVIEAMRS